MQTSMDLTTEQQQAVESGQELRVTNPHTQTEYVVIRADVYERVKTARYDDSEWTPDEMDILAAEAAERLDNAEKIE